MANLPDVPDRSFLSQKFARLQFGPYSVVGYSVAGEETVVQVPELGICFDCGRTPQFALTSDILCISHAHMDHLAGLAYFISQRYFQGLKPPTILVPAEIADPVDDMLLAWRRIERQQTPYDLVEMRPGQMYRVRNDFGIRCHRTHHGGPSLGYSAISIRHKLKDEYHDRTSDQIRQLKEDGVEIQYVKEVPLVTYLGDTGAGPVWKEPDIVEAQILLTECTFFEPDHKRTAKAGRHLHAMELANYLPRLNNEHVVLLHLSRRTGLGRAKRLLKDAVTDASLLDRVHFLMDLHDSAESGDAAAGPQGQSQDADS
ncbi:MAG: MBL fold metallo-hydrolase [Planctomycetota bacterium]